MRKILFIILILGSITRLPANLPKSILSIKHSEKLPDGIAIDQGRNPTIAFAEQKFHNNKLSFFFSLYKGDTFRKIYQSQIHLERSVFKRTNRSLAFTPNGQILIASYHDHVRFFNNKAPYQELHRAEKIYADKIYVTQNSKYAIFSRAHRKSNHLYFYDLENWTTITDMKVISTPFPTAMTSTIDGLYYTAKNNILMISYDQIAKGNFRPELIYSHDKAIYSIHIDEKLGRLFFTDGINLTFLDHYSGNIVHQMQFAALKSYYDAHRYRLYAGAIAFQSAPNLIVDVKTYATFDMSSELHDFFEKGHSNPDIYQYTPFEKIYIFPPGLDQIILQRTSGNDNGSIIVKFNSSTE